MEPLILAYVTAWLVMRLWETAKAEWRHTRDGYARTLGRDHPDWSPARVRRNARAAARSWWWTEIRDGLPTFAKSWEKNKLLARTQREEMLAAGEKGLRVLRERLDTARKAREAGREAAKAPEPPPPGGTPGKPALKTIDGGKAPRRTGTPPPGTQAKPPVPPGPEPPSPAPTGAGGIPASPESASPPEPPSAEPATEGASPVTAISGPGWAATRGVSREEADNFVRTGHTDGTYPAPGSPGYQSGDNPVAEINGGPVVATQADTESGDSPFEGMLNTASKIAGTARASATTVGDDLRAAASVHGFSRDSATMAGIAEVEDAFAAAAAAAERLRTGMMSRHADGAEYHNGQDADASAFRAT